MANTHTLTVSKVEKETKDTITIHFDIPAHLRSEFDYEPGQYLTLEAVLNDRKEKRSYSLCSSPLTDLSHAVTVKRLEGGLVSNYLNDNCFEGMVMNVMPPMGVFIPSLNEANEVHYVMIGGGSGITPLMSIIKSVLFLEPKSKVTLLYANRDQESIIFEKELEAMASKEGDRFNLVHCLSQPKAGWEGLSGRLDELALNKLLSKHAGDVMRKEYFMCGPNGLIDCALETLTKRGVPGEQLHKEYFVIEAKGDVEGIETRTVKIIYENEEFEVTVDPETVILDAAIDADIDPPYACKAAACSACRAKLVSGKVHMDDREILSDDEIEQGYVLTCQSHPLTDDVVVNYDE